MAEQKTIKKVDKNDKVAVRKAITKAVAKADKVMNAPPTPEQQHSDMMSYLNSLRSNIILTYDSSKETAARAFDEVSNKLIQYVRYAQKSDEMVAELKKEIEKLKKAKK